MDPDHASEGLFTSYRRLTSVPAPPELAAGVMERLAETRRPSSPILILGAAAGLTAILSVGMTLGLLGWDHDGGAEPPAFSVVRSLSPSLVSSP